MSILLEITSFCFSLMKNEIRDRLMMKYLSSRLRHFIFKYGPHPSRKVPACYIKGCSQYALAGKRL